VPVEVLPYHLPLWPWRPMHLVPCSTSLVAASLAGLAEPFPCSYASLFFTAEEEESGKGEKRKRETDDEGEDD
jgi:hypothetical protein